MDHSAADGGLTETQKYLGSAADAGTPAGSACCVTAPVHDAPAGTPPSASATSMAAGLPNDSLRQALMFHLLAVSLQHTYCRRRASTLFKMVLNLHFSQQMSDWQVAQTLSLIPPSCRHKRKDASPPDLRHFLPSVQGYTVITRSTP